MTPTTDPPIVALDIETYGAVEQDDLGPLPPQNHFHPRKMEAFDGVPPCRQIPSIALTTCTHDPRPTPTTPWSFHLLSQLAPASTLIFDLSDPHHVRLLLRWLQHADTIIGWNLLFDFLCLRAQRLLRHALLGRHFIIDGTVISFLQDPSRPHHDLKSVSHNLCLALYPRTLKDGHRFKSIRDPHFRLYQASDPHISILCVSRLASLLLADRPDPGPFVLQHFSDLAYTGLRLSESGIPLARSRLLTLQRRLTTLTTRSVQAALPHLLLEGKGSATPTVPNSKPAFLRSITDRHPTLLDHPLLELSKKRKSISWSDRNRSLLRLLLPPDDPQLPVVHASSIESRAAKLLSTYLRPLLNPKDPTDTSSLLLPSTNDIRFVYPSWYLTPSAVKDDQGNTGGQVQGRISAKEPASQTWPPPIKRCIRSRFGRSGTIVSFDLSQIELRTSALLSGEPSLLLAYAQNLDLHTDRTITLFGSPFDKRLRQVGKMVNFADLFRAAAPTMQLNVFKKTGIYIPITIFDRAVASRPTVRPVLYAWQESLLAEAQSTGRLILPITGVMRHFTGDALADHENEIVNFPVQTTASIVFLRILHYINRHLPPLTSLRSTPCHLFLTVHDSAYFDCLTSFVPTLRHLISSAVTWCATSDLWHLLQLHTSNTVPLKYDLTLHHS